MKIVLVVGARPNFIKIAPIIRAVKQHNIDFPNNSLEYLLVHTGQHYDYEMSQIFFKDLNIPEPDIHLGVGSGTHAEQTGRIMMALEKVLLQNKPELVMTPGDTNSTLASALTAVKIHVAVAHIESGVRTFDSKMPEEINRVLTDHMSDYLFTTSHYDNVYLKREGISLNKIYTVGNIIADSILQYREMASKADTLQKFNLVAGNYALVTLHREANVDNKEKLLTILTEIANISKAISVVFPVHPRTKKNLETHGILNLLPQNNIKYINPLGYIDMLNLEMNSRFVITDSGGIQVETTILGIPCLTVMDYEVWPITNKEGTNRLVGSNCEKLQKEVKVILKGNKKNIRCPELWDGKTAERIVKIITKNN
jgi:UDP-N-acetylglucosamine 2-epimerase (non-hydrolysing)